MVAGNDESRLWLASCFLRAEAGIRDLERSGGPGILYKRRVRILNASKGPAVRATRAQADRVLYRQAVRTALEPALIHI